MAIFTVHWMAVIVCVIASLVIGAVWFNPLTFFPLWWSGIGKTENDMIAVKRNMGFIWTLTVVSAAAEALFMAFAVNVAAEVFGGTGLVPGAVLGFAVWLGAIAPTYLVNTLFAGHGLAVWAIEAGNHLLNFIVFGAILGAWR